MSVLGRQILEDHSQLPKQANECNIGVVNKLMVA